MRTTQAFSQANEYEDHDVDAAEGCIRSVEHAYTKEATTQKPPTTTKPTKPTTVGPDLAPGDKGDAVRRLQLELRRLRVAEVQPHAA